MSGTRSSAAGDLTRALAQTAAAIGAHALAAGCLPSGHTLALAVPSCVVGILLLGRLMAGHPLLLLASGQLTAHAVLALAACTGHAVAHVVAHSAAHPAAGPATQAGADAHLVMTFAHVLALVLCRAVLGGVVALVDRTAAVVTGLARRAVSLLAAPPLRPEVVPRRPETVPVPLTGRVGWPTARGRAPPRGLGLLAA